MGGHKVSHSDQYRYFTMSETAQHELIRATNELHLMYLHATDKVLKDDKLLAIFQYSKIAYGLACDCLGKIAVIKPLRGV